MKTAEQILLDKSGMGDMSVFSFLKGDAIPYKIVLEAMEEHAKQVTIEFMKDLGMSESKEGKTYEEIYEDFLEKQ